MKNKKLSYFLICAVIAVWGFIVYNIVLAIPKNEPTPAPKRTAMTQSEVSLSPAEEDTFTLLLNYRDPFLETEAQDESGEEEFNDNSGIPLQIIKTPAPAPVNWDGIKYTGFIVNSVNSRLVSIVVVNGKELMLVDGQTISGYKLVKNYGDSIKVLYKDHTKFLTLK